MGTMPTVNVSLKNNKISVDQHVIQASVSQGHKVQWKSNDGPFQVKFKDGSDFPHPGHASHANGAWTAECGPFQKKHEHTTLSYAVTADGYPDLDPDIQVIP